MTVAGSDDAECFDTSDRVVTFNFCLTPEDLETADRVFSMQWLLDSDAPFHVTSCRDWFSSYASSTHGSVRLQDGTVHAIAGSREVRLSPVLSGMMVVLQDERYVLEFSTNLISIGQLRESACHVLLFEQYFTLHLGPLRVARGASDGTSYPCHMVHTQDGLVSVWMQP